MNAQRVARLQVVHDHLAVELNPGLALSLEPLQAKPGASENPRTQPLLEADRELDPDGGSHEAVAMNHVALARRDLQGQDLARQLGGKRKQAGATDRRVLGHEERAAGHRAAVRTKQATLLAAEQPALFFPSMNATMWGKDTTRRYVAALRAAMPKLVRNG